MTLGFWRISPISNLAHAREACKPPLASQTKTRSVRSKNCTFQNRERHSVTVSSYSITKNIVQQCIPSLQCFQLRAQKNTHTDTLRGGKTISSTALPCFAGSIFYGVSCFCCFFVFNAYNVYLFTECVREWKTVNRFTRNVIFLRHIPGNGCDSSSQGVFGRIPTKPA